jgi:hypothetical protein
MRQCWIAPSEPGFERCGTDCTWGRCM